MNRFKRYQAALDDEGPGSGAAGIHPNDSEAAARFAIADLTAAIGNGRKKLVAELIKIRRVAVAPTTAKERAD